MALSSECEVHGWSWDPADDMGCPVCHGIALEQQRCVDALEASDSACAGWAIATIQVVANGLD